MDMDDKQLAVLAGQGDANAWRTLFERYQQPVYNFVYRLVDNAEDAADIVQNSFIKVFMALGKTDVSNFSAYLYRTARNLAYDEMRHRQRFADVDHEILAPEDPNIYADPQRALMLGEQIGMVRRAVGNLSENHRAALMLRELQELDYDEIAEVLESNRNAVGALLSRARLRFREELRMVQVQTEEIPEECEQIIALLSPYIDNELPEAELSRVEAHCAACTFCAAALEEMQEASRSFRLLIPVIPPADIAQAVTGHMEQLTGQASGGETAQGQSGAETTQAMPSQPPAETTLLKRLLKYKIIWGVAAAALIFGGGALLLAEGSGDQESGSPALVATTSTGTGTQTRAARTTSTPTATSSSTTPTEAGAQAGETDTMTDNDTSTEVQTSPSVTVTVPGNTATTPANPPPSNVDISSSYLYPSPAYDIRPVSFEVYVTGNVAAVSIRATDASTGMITGQYGLALSGSDSGGQLWAGSHTLSSGTYNIYAVAAGSDGVAVSQLVQVLEVIPYRG